MKQCNRCNEVKELNEFNKDKNGKYKRGHWCRSCCQVYRRSYYQENKDRVKAIAKKWAEDNPDKFKANARRYRADRYANDPAYRLVCKLRRRVTKVIRGNSKSASTLDLLGCSAEHARFHIESQFTGGMTWENTHIDHIQPCASFDLEDPHEQRRCFHYTNLQPLFAEDNLRKSDSIVPEHQVRLL